MSAQGVTSRNRGRVDESYGSLTPLADAIERERIEAEKALIIDTSKAEHAAEKVAAAEAVLDIESVEKAYTEYIAACEALVIAFATLENLIPTQRSAARTLGVKFPEPMSVRSSHDHEMKVLREQAFAAGFGDV